MRHFVTKAWFRKVWHVYTMGYSKSDYRWVASFSSEEYARAYAGLPPS